MWKLWIIAILGASVILMPNLGFPIKWTDIFFEAAGVVTVIFSLWVISESRHKTDRPEV